MDIAITHQMKKQDRIDLNLICIYVGVCQLSDITNAIGDRISESVWRCTPFLINKVFYNIQGNRNHPLYSAEPGAHSSNIYYYPMQNYLSFDLFNLSAPGLRHLQ